MTPFKVIDTQWQNPEMHASAERQGDRAVGVGCVTGQGWVTRDKLSITGRRVCMKVPPTPYGLQRVWGVPVLSG